MNVLNSESEFLSAFLTPSPVDVLMESPVDNFPINLPMSNSINENIDESEQVRDKFMSMFSENGNDSVPNSNVIYPDLAQQVNANESEDSQIIDEVGSSQYIENVAIIGSDRNSSLEHSHTTDNNLKVEFSNLDENTPIPLDNVSTFSTPDSRKDSGDKIENFSNKQIRKSIISESKEIVIFSSSDNSCDIEYILSRNIHNTSKIPETNEIKDLSISVEQEKTKGFESQDSIERKVKESKSDLTKIASIKPIVSNAKNNESSNIEDNEHCLKTDGWSLESAKQRSFGQVVNFKKLNKTRGTQTLSDSQCLDIEDRKEIGLTESETEDSEFSQMETFHTKRESHLEIDGKYLKSLVNSKKSPKKVKLDGKLKTVEHQKSDETTSEGDQSIYEESREVWSSPDSKAKSNVNLQNDNVRNVNLKDDNFRIDKETNTLSHEKMQRNSNILQGSLDSFDIRKPTNEQTFESMAKKSRSLELIKNNPLSFKSPLTYSNPKIIYDETLRPKSESTFQLVTGNNFDDQTDNFCSECYLANDPSSTELFYTIRSNCSSPLEDSTECDICSSCNLPDSADILEYKMLPKSKSVCEVCEICGEPAIEFEEDNQIPVKLEKPEVTSRRVTSLKSLHLSLPKTNIESDEEMISLNQTNLEDDRFEIENCGMQGEKKILVKEKSKKETEIENKNLDESVGKETSITISRVDFQGPDFFVPKDEVIMLTENSKRLSRKGSFLRKTSDRQEKRRYSSADNLQHKLFFKGNDRFFKSKDVKLMASADSIRPMKHFRSRSLRRSSDNIGRSDSSNDNLDRLEETVDIDEEGTKEEITGPEEIKRKDSDSLETILLKHGIKLISQKETVL